MTISHGLKTDVNTLPIILIAAVVQGWSLYALHLAIEGSHWPATAPAWLLGFYAVAVFIPLTVQLLAEHARRATFWTIVGPMALMFFYFGWHHGARVMDRSAETFVSSGEWFPMAFVLGVLWLLLAPFIQCRLAEGRWRASYAALFATAWRNKLTLAEAALFTGLFWLLLFLWQALFKMLGIGFFKELFEEPIFVYPVTSLAFGFALHLIGSLDRLTGVVLEQILNVLKWLALVAALILTLFTAALIFKLPGMIASGDRAISAAWLLWLVAVTVLLVNAAYRDGAVERPYPKWIAFALRCAVPLIVVIALTSLYALYVRIDAYGFTVERVWAVIVAGAACVYAMGYALAARASGRWMAGVARVNVVTAWLLIVTIGLALTPVLSPYRIAANSQFRLAQAQESPRPQTARQYRNDTPFHYLRFSAGDYGMARLRELTHLERHPRAAEIREAAETMIAQEHRWSPPSPLNLASRLDGIVLHPAERSLPPELRAQLETDLKDPDRRRAHVDDAVRFAGLFVDLNDDGIEEFVLFTGPFAQAWERESGGWRWIGQMRSPNLSYGEDVVGAVTAGEVRVQEPTWNELVIGPSTFRMAD